MSLPCSLAMSALAFVAGTAQAAPPVTPPLPQASLDAPIELGATKLPGPIRNAGIYHVATGTWTRVGGGQASFGPDVIYSNTAASGYFSSAGGNGGFAPMSTNYDEGGIPGTQNTDHPAADRDEYSVNGFEIGYCDMDQSPMASGWEIGFYSKYVLCLTPQTAPDARIHTGPMPSGGCWTVTIDLTGGAEFTLGADGGDGFQDDPHEDRFAWSFRYTGTGAGTSPAGFLLQGDPDVTDPCWQPSGGQNVPRSGTNTYYGDPSPCGSDHATGYLTFDRWHATHPSGVWNNCYWFGGYRNNNGCGGPANPMASWHMEILAETGPGEELAGLPYCESTYNSSSFTSTLFISGSADPADDDVLLRSQLSPGSFGYFLTSQTPGFTALPAGSQGNLCLAGDVGRFVGPGQLKNSGPDGWITLDTNLGEWSVSAIPAPTASYAAAPGVTTHFQLWHRDSVGGSATSNFSDAKAVTWE